jgi:hypothetical protein
MHTDSAYESQMHSLRESTTRRGPVLAIAVLVYVNGDARPMLTIFNLIVNVCLPSVPVSHCRTRANV